MRFKLSPILALGCVVFAVSWLALSPLRAAEFSILYANIEGEGFLEGDVGEERREAFEFAVDIWARQLVSDVEITVHATMESLGGDEFSAVLGGAGAESFQRDYPNAPRANTWYAVALANSLAGQDLDPRMVEDEEDLSTDGFDIVAVFNSDVDGTEVLGDVTWYYGTDALPPGDDVDFVTVVLHELGHGLGFFDLIDPGNGTWMNNFPDIYGIQLTRAGDKDFVDMTDTERLVALTSGQVFWVGPKVFEQENGPVKIYAPRFYEQGSSISHWDVTNSPDRLMEPFINRPIHEVDLTKPAFQDIGWRFVDDGPVEPTPTPEPTQTPTPTPSPSPTPGGRPDLNIHSIYPLSRVVNVADGFVLEMVVDNAGEGFAPVSVSEIWLSPFDPTFKDELTGTGNDIFLRDLWVDQLLGGETIELREAQGNAPFINLTSAGPNHNQQVPPGEYTLGVLGDVEDRVPNELGEHNIFIMDGTITVVAEAPEAPTKPLPEPGDENISVTRKLSWDDAENAAQYDVFLSRYIDTDLNFIRTEIPKPDVALEDPAAVAMGDLDLDGDIDVVSAWREKLVAPGAGAGPGAVVVHLNRGESPPAFSSFVVSGATGFRDYTSLAIANLDAGGDEDFGVDIIATTFSGQAYFYMNKGGSFEEVRVSHDIDVGEDFPITVSPGPGTGLDQMRGLAVNDFDLDGDIDFITGTDTGFLTYYESDWEHRTVPTDPEATPLPVIPRFIPSHIRDDSPDPLTLEDAPDHHELIASQLNFNEAHHFHDVVAPPSDHPHDQCAEEYQFDRDLTADILPDLVSISVKDDELSMYLNLGRTGRALVPDSPDAIGTPPIAFKRITIGNMNGPKSIFIPDFRDLKPPEIYAAAFFDKALYRFVISGYEDYNPVTCPARTFITDDIYPPSPEAENKIRGLHPPLVVPIFERQTVTSDFPDAEDVFAADVSGDGILDVLGTAAIEDRITLFVSDGKEDPEPNYSEFDLTRPGSGSTSNRGLEVGAADLDSDGLLDIVAVDSFDHELSLFISSPILPDDSLVAQNLSSNEFQPPKQLGYDQVYVWRVRSKTGVLTELGDQWSFRTQPTFGEVTFDSNPADPLLVEPNGLLDVQLILKNAGERNINREIMEPGPDGAKITCAILLSKNVHLADGIPAPSQVRPDYVLAEFRFNPDEDDIPSDFEYYRYVPPFTFTATANNDPDPAPGGGASPPPGGGENPPTSTGIVPGASRSDFHTFFMELLQTVGQLTNPDNHPPPFGIEEGEYNIFIIIDMEEHFTNNRYGDDITQLPFQLIVVRIPDVPDGMPDGLIPPDGAIGIDVATLFDWSDTQHTTDYDIFLVKATGMTSEFTSSPVTSARNVRSVASGDLDRDGDVDLVGAYQDFGGRVEWYRSTGGAAPQFTALTIEQNLEGPREVLTYDVDADGQLDVVAAFLDSDAVAWYENNGGAVPDFTRHVVTDLIDGATSVCAVDLERDGDTDLLTASSLNGRLLWHVGDSSSGPLTHSQTVILDNTSGAPNNVTAADLTGNGFPDVIATYTNNPSIKWYENNGAVPTTFTPHTVTTTAITGPSTVQAADINRDGHADLVITSEFDDMVAWYENDGAATPTFSLRVVTRAAAGVNAAEVADIDNDGDPDIFSASKGDGRMVWYINDGAPDPSFSEFEIEQQSQPAFDIHVVDFDNEPALLEVIGGIGGNQPQQGSIKWYDMSRKFIFDAPLPLQEDANTTESRYDRPELLDNNSGYKWMVRANNELSEKTIVSTEGPQWTFATGGNPDLIIVDGTLGTDRPTASQGSSFEVHWIESNIGNGTARGHWTSIYASPDPEITGTGNDIYLGMVWTNPIAPSQLVQVALTVDSGNLPDPNPGPLPLGTYTIGALLDEFDHEKDELDESNTFIATQQLTITESNAVKNWIFYD